MRADQDQRTMGRLPIYDHTIFAFLAIMLFVGRPLMVQALLRVLKFVSPRYHRNDRSLVSLFLAGARVPSELLAATGIRDLE